MVWWVGPPGPQPTAPVGLVFAATMRISRKPLKARAYTMSNGYCAARSDTALYNQLMDATLAIVLAASILATPALAQISGFTLVDKSASVVLTFTTPRGSLAPAVTSAPYSADQDIQQVRTLPDGSHITQAPGVRHVVRDSQGRTRIDRPVYVKHDSGASTFSVIEIRDPVDGFYYILDDQAKVAHRFAVTRAAATPQLVSPPASDPPSAPTTTAPKNSDATHPKTSVEKLGSKWIEGVMTEGQRATTTWPAGSQGNDGPIVFVHEAWVSPDLHIEVRTSMSDPRVGDTTMRLTNITRAEPDPALLQPPPDYTIVDEKASFTMTVTRN